MRVLHMQEQNRLEQVPHMPVPRLVQNRRELSLRKEEDIHGQELVKVQNRQE